MNRAKLIMKNDLPPACILGKALTINCKSTLPGLSELTSYSRTNRALEDLCLLVRSRMNRISAIHAVMYVYE